MIKLIKGFVIINVQKRFGTPVDIPRLALFHCRFFCQWKFKTPKAKQNDLEKLFNRCQTLMYRLRRLQMTNSSLLTQVGILVISHDKPPQT